MEVTHIFQEHEAFCGPAVAQMVLGRFGIMLSQQEIAKELETDMVVGTSARELEKFFLSRGYGVERKNSAEWEELILSLAKGSLIVGYTEREGDPHYALVRAVDDEKIVLADPWHGDNFMLPKEEFLERWKDNEVGQYGERMCMVITPPEAR